MHNSMEILLGDLTGDERINKINESMEKLLGIANDSGAHNPIVISIHPDVFEKLSEAAISFRASVAVIGRSHKPMTDSLTALANANKRITDANKPKRPEHEHGWYNKFNKPLRGK